VFTDCTKQHISALECSAYNDTSTTKMDLN